MAKRTGTLWQNVTPSASCNHGFASYAANLLIRACTGYLDFNVEKGVVQFENDFYFKDNLFVKIPFNNGSVTVEITNGERKITSKEYKVEYKIIL